MGSVMVSYTKSRAEALGFDCNVGVLTRMERYLVMTPALIFNRPIVALWVKGMVRHAEAPAGIAGRTAVVMRGAYGVEPGLHSTRNMPHASRFLRSLPHDL
jgi:hypothetical protein